MLKYSFKALKALPKFFSYRNDVDIYTEDRVADKEFYKTLLCRLLEDKIKVNDITPLGSKDNVINAFKCQKIEKNGRKKFYIIDGDLDLITDSNIKKTKNLIVLNSYCIENYIIDEFAATELIHTSIGTKDKESIANKLKFNEWLNFNCENLIDLFISLAISKKHCVGPKLKSAHLFIKQQGEQRILDKQKIKEYSLTVQSETIKTIATKGQISSEKLFYQEFTKLKKKWPTNIETMLKIVSGKDYLLPLLQFRINYCISKNKSLVSKESFKLFLAKHCELDRLEFLKKAITS